MGKKLLVIILMAGAAYLIYRQTHRPATEQELAVKAVEERFLSASNKYIGAAAGGMAGGLDEAESAVVQVQKVRLELARLRKTLTEERAIAKADQLQAKVDEFCRKNEIR